MADVAEVSVRFVKDEFEHVLPRYRATPRKIARLFNLQWPNGLFLKEAANGNSTTIVPDEPYLDAWIVTLNPATYRVFGITRTETSSSLDSSAPTASDDQQNVANSSGTSSGRPQISLRPISNAGRHQNVPSVKIKVIMGELEAHETTPSHHPSRKGCDVKVTDEDANVPHITEVVRERFGNNNLKLYTRYGTEIFDHEDNTGLENWKSKGNKFVAYACEEIPFATVKRRKRRSLGKEDWDHLSEATASVNQVVSALSSTESVKAVQVYAKVKQDLVCGICLELLKSPVPVQCKVCSRFFCTGCLETWRNESLFCAFCKSTDLRFARVRIYDGELYCEVKGLRNVIESFVD